MTTKEFIEKAIEGGWRYHGEKLVWDENLHWWYVTDGDGGFEALVEQEIFLDPKAWQAVARVEGWKERWHERHVSGYHYKMLRMIDALCREKTIEKFLETL